MASKHQTATIKKYEKQGYFVINLIKTNKTGIPDLLCLKQGEVPMFIECKEHTDRVSPIQEYRIKELTDLGFIAFVDKKTT